MAEAVIADSGGEKANHLPVLQHDDSPGAIQPYRPYVSIDGNLPVPPERAVWGAIDFEPLDDGSDGARSATFVGATEEDRRSDVVENDSVSRCEEKRVVGDHPAVAEGRIDVALGSQTANVAAPCGTAVGVASNGGSRNDDPVCGVDRCSGDSLHAGIGRGRGRWQAEVGDDGAVPVAEGRIR